MLCSPLCVVDDPFLEGLEKSAEIAGAGDFAFVLLTMSTSAVSRRKS